MRIFSFFLIALATAGAMMSCGLNFKTGDGNIEETQTNVGPFDRINIGGNFDVLLIPSDMNSVMIRGDENLMKYINVEVHNESLNINTIHNLKSSEGIDITINYTTLKGIFSTGTSKITHNNALKTHELTIDLSGTGSIEMEVSADTTDVTMTGAGLVKLSGQTTHLEATLSGAGGLIAEDLVSQNCYISLSGVGGASVNVTEKLDANISGIGGISYSGNPKVMEKRITGLGKITASDEDPE